MIVVWKRPNDTYYFRDVKGFYTNYQIGYLNQYNHEVILIIENSVSPHYSMGQKFIKFLIRFLRKFENERRTPLC